MQLELADIVKLYNRIDELEKRVAQLEVQTSKQSSTKLSCVERPAFPAECANTKPYPSFYMKVGKNVLFYLMRNLKIF